MAFTTRAGLLTTTHDWHGWSAAVRWSERVHGRTLLDTRQEQARRQLAVEQRTGKNQSVHRVHRSQDPLYPEGCQ